MEKLCLIGMSMIVCTSILAGCGNNQATQNGQKGEATNEKLVAYGELDPQVSGQQIIAEEKGFSRKKVLMLKIN